MTPGGAVTVLGSINMDTLLDVATFPAPGETIMALGAAKHAGGKGANQAIAAARAGVAVRMMGAVGDDADGQAMLALLTAEGIDTSAIVTHVALPTGAAIVTVDARGENQIVVLPGANAAARVPDAVIGVRLAQLELPLDTVRAFLSAERHGALAILNAAPFRHEAAPLLALADILVVNQVELAGYSDGAAPPASTSAATDMAQALRCDAKQTVVVTLGADGSVAVGPDGIHVTPAAPARVVDTTGAGDCFCGYLAAGLAAGLTLAAAIADAHRAAAHAVARKGAAPSMPRRRDLEAG